MSTLQLNLLGPPQIFLAGAEVTTFNTRKDQALLLYLAQSGRTHSREELAALFWSDMPEARARPNLAHALTHLRRAIGPDWFTGPTQVGISPDKALSVDTHRLAMAMKLGDTPGPNEWQRLEEGLSLYRGDFLQGFYLRGAALFEEWMLARREEYRLLALTGLEKLAAHCLAGGFYSRGLAASRRLLALEPWSEPGHVLQMELLARDGQRTAALEQYQNLRARLDEELQVEPLPATTALFEQIRSGAYWPESHRTAEVAAGRGANTAVTHGASSAAAPVAVPIGPPPPPHNLPAPLVPLIGYREELTYLRTQIERGESRLLTITGMGGAGKTHLALEVGRRMRDGAGAALFADGVYFVALDSVAATSKAEVAENSIAFAIAGTLGFAFQGYASPQTQLLARLTHAGMLLILDNMEQLLAGSRLITGLLERASGVCVLVTSREKLGVQGERVVDLRGLQQSDAAPGADDDDSHPNDAVTLFVHRAQMANHRFRLDKENARQIARICRLVGGLPLGIEIAAHWLGSFDLAAIEERTTAAFDFLRSNRRDIPDRHRSLRAVFNHSWELLSPSQQKLLAALALFQPTFPFEAASAVTGASPPDFDDLVSRSLLGRRDNGRFSMHLAIQQFAQEKLQAQERLLREMQERYVSYYLNLLSTSADILYAPQWAAVQPRLFDDMDNLKAAFWQAFQRHQWAALNRAAETMRFLYDNLGWYWEAHEFCLTALGYLSRLKATGSEEEEQSRAILVGRLMTVKAECEGRLGRLALCMDSFQAALAHLRRTQAEIEATSPGTANAQQSQWALGFCLAQYGVGRNAIGQTAESIGLLEEALIRTENQATYPLTLYGLALAYFRLGNYPQARHYAQTALGLAQTAKDPRRPVFLHNVLGQIERAVGRYEEAGEHFQQSHAVASQVGDQVGFVDALKDLGDIARVLGDPRRARTLLEQALKIAAQKDLIVMRAATLWALGNLALGEGDFAAARDYFLESRRPAPLPQLTFEQLPTLGWALIGLGDLSGAEEYFRESLQIARRAHANRAVSEALGGLAVLMGMGGDKETSAALLQAILAAPATARETKERLTGPTAPLRPRRESTPEKNYRFNPGLRALIEETLATSFPHPVTIATL